MREILFRGRTPTTMFPKPKDPYKWVYGDLCHYPVDDDVAYYIKEIDNQEPNHRNIHFVMPDTIGQYTGLTDKNGVKIFEGDIVRFYDNTGEYEDGKIFWDTESACFGVRWIGDIPSEFDDFDAEHRTVIGNKWDGVEALSGKEA